MIRWYGVLWVAAFGVAGWLLPKLQKYRRLELSRGDWLYLLSAGMFGAVMGGRLGYVLLYEPGYFAAHPTEILAIWDGGMASHGGFLGVGVAMWLAARRLNIDILKLLDVIVVPAALGLALGRVGNFINQELFNPPALAFLAVAKDILIAAITYIFLPKNKNPGSVLAVFLMSYGLLRFFVEFVRVQEFPGLLGLTRGQLFTLPVILMGGLLFLWQQKRHSKPPTQP